MPGRRVHERYDRRLRIEVHHEGGTLLCVTRNISLGGVFLITDQPLSYGTPVRLVFHLPALKQDVDLEATVRWIMPDGMGVQFGSLRAREVWGLNQLFRGAPLAD